jgi:hypothetical protein
MMKETLLVMVKSLFVVSQAKCAVPDEQETYLRQNFNKSNNINYRDGDKQSLSTTILENQSLTMLIKN